MNIVFVASEAAPLAKTGGLADVVGSLPAALQAQGEHQIHLIMPYYKQHIHQTGFQLWQTIELWIDGQTRQIGLYRQQLNGVHTILVEADDLYDRPELYGPADGAYLDNPLRYTLLVRAALEASCRLDDQVDIFHCHDWQSALLPMLLKKQYAFRTEIAHAKCIYTIHNLAYQGVFDAKWLARLHIPAEDFHSDGFEFYEQINCMKAGILHADLVTTVSPTYAQEITTPAFGQQLDGFLRQHSHKLRGILNGLDLEEYNPANNKNLAKPFKVGAMTGKKACKKALQKQTGLTQDPKKPLLTLVSRLAEQKGITLILDNMQHWVDQGYQLAILGSGIDHYESIFTEFAQQYPQQVYFYQGFSNELAHQIYAAGDFFLMPSHFEPCGLGQLIAMRYGNLPIVMNTGGLSDTVIDASQSDGTGFVFNDHHAQALQDATERAVQAWQHQPSFSRLRARSMRRDSSWHAAAQTYLNLYEGLSA
ncbi:MAG: glycogen synthase GlgA [Mariprofundaceae bacterium]|nr:glycogen synthase GlgA [Mariprofundaceae bacterium]